MKNCCRCGAPMADEALYCPACCLEQPPKGLTPPMPPIGQPGGYPPPYGAPPMGAGQPGGYPPLYGNGAVPPGAGQPGAQSPGGYPPPYGNFGNGAVPAGMRQPSAQSPGGYSPPYSNGAVPPGMQQPGAGAPGTPQPGGYMPPYAGGAVPPGMQQPGGYPPPYGNGAAPAGMQQPGSYPPYGVPPAGMPPVSGTASAAAPGQGPSMQTSGQFPTSAPDKAAAGSGGMKKKTMSPEKKYRRIMLLLAGVCAILAGILVLAIAGAFSASRSEKAVMNAFIDAVSQNEFEKALSVCAIDERSEAYDLSAAVQRGGYYNPAMLAPSNGGILSGANRAQLAGNFGAALQMFCTSLVDEDNQALLAQSSVSTADAGAMRQLTDWVKQVEKSPWESLEIVSLYEYTPTEEIQEILDKNKVQDSSGASEDKYILALLHCKNGYYAKGFQLTAYRGKWKISGFFAPIHGDSPFGDAKLVSRADFYDLVRRDPDQYSKL